MVGTLGTHATVIKSDTLAPQALREPLHKSFDRLMEDTRFDPAVRPSMNGMVGDLVNPSFLPPVYGRTRVVRDEIVTVADAIDTWTSKGTVIPRAPRPRKNVTAFRTTSTRWGLLSGAS